MTSDNDPTQEHRDDNIEIEEEAAATYPLTSPSGIPRESEMVQALLPGVSACWTLLANDPLEDRMFVHYVAIAASIAALKVLRNPPDTGQQSGEQTS